MNKHYALEKAIEITKEYARSEGKNLHPDEMLDRLYKKLKELSQDASEEI